MSTRDLRQVLASSRSAFIIQLAYLVLYVIGPDVTLFPRWRYLSLRIFDHGRTVLVLDGEAAVRSTFFL